MKVAHLILLASCLTLSCESASVITKAETSFIETSKVTSWNHIEEKQGVYATLNQAAQKYQLNKQVTSSTNNPFYQITLVKKLLNWEQQHSNGVEVSLQTLNLQVKQLNQLHFKIKLSPENSIITTNVAALSEKNPWLPPSQDYTALLSKHANFTLVFYGEHHDNSQSKTLYGAYPFKLAFDSKQQWLDINITPADLNYYWQQDYQEEPTSLAKVGTEKLLGFILVAESANTKVVRNYTPKTFPKQHIEVFNEFSITLKDLKVSSSP